MPSHKSPRRSPGDAQTEISAEGLSIILSTWPKVLLAAMAVPLAIVFVALMVTSAKWMPENWDRDGYACSSALAAVGVSVLTSFAFLPFAIIWLHRAVRQPWKIVFGVDGVTLQRPKGERKYAWDELAGIRGRQHQEVTREATGMILLPIGIGAVALTSYEDKVVRWRDFQLLSAENENVLATFAPSYDFDRWYHQQRAADELGRCGASVSWDRATVVGVSFAGKPIDDLQLQTFVPSFERLPNLATIDLSNTRVTDSGLQLLVGLQQVDQVTTTGTLVTEAGRRDFDAAKQVRRQQGDFAFLG